MAIKKNSIPESDKEPDTKETANRPARENIPAQGDPLFNYGPTDINGNPLVHSDGLPSFQDHDDAQTATYTGTGDAGFVTPDDSKSEEDVEAGR